MDMGADDDEMDMMYAMEQEQNAADKDGGAFDEPAAGPRAPRRPRRAPTTTIWTGSPTRARPRPRGPEPTAPPPTRSSRTTTRTRAQRGRTRLPIRALHLRLPFERRDSPQPRAALPAPTPGRPSHHGVACPSPPPTGAGCSSDGSPRPWPTTRRGSSDCRARRRDCSRGRQEAVSAFRLVEDMLDRIEARPTARGGAEGVRTSRRAANGASGGAPRGSDRRRRSGTGRGLIACGWTSTLPRSSTSSLARTR